MTEQYRTNNTHTFCGDNFVEKHGKRAQDFSFLRTESKNRAKSQNMMCKTLFTLPTWNKRLLPKCCSPSLPHSWPEAEGLLIFVSVRLLRRSSIPCRAARELFRHLTDDFGWNETMLLTYWWLQSRFKLKYSTYARHILVSNCTIQAPL